ncbi:hypothetical protein BH11MYX2_BH11MYX2_36990 [soil metagenome]
MSAADADKAIVQAPLAQSSPQRDDNSAAEVADVLDVPHVARLLGVGRNTIYSLVARNGIPHRRLGKAIRGRCGTRRRGSNACTTRFPY